MNEDEKILTADKKPDYEQEIIKKIKVDPAVASGPLITTVNDLVAVVAYYGMSWVLLLNVMHLAE
jgi:hypothetical protein